VTNDVSARDVQAGERSKRLDRPIDSASSCAVAVAAVSNRAAIERAVASTETVAVKPDWESPMSSRRSPDPRRVCSFGTGTCG
jgi:hypothetical protein